MKTISKQERLERSKAYLQLDREKLANPMHHDNGICFDAEIISARILQWEKLINQLEAA